MFVITFTAFFFYCFNDDGNLHSFPTRRSSDLDREKRKGINVTLDEDAADRLRECVTAGGEAVFPSDTVYGERPRSEEHTSELQSLRHLVCRLLLGKKRHPARSLIQLINDHVRG